MTEMTDRELEEYVSRQLVSKDLEELMSLFDLTPEEVFIHLYRNGLIDDLLIEETSEL